VHNNTVRYYASFFHQVVHKSTHIRKVMFVNMHVLKFQNSWTDFDEISYGFGCTLNVGVRTYFWLELAHYKLYST